MRVARFGDGEFSHVAPHEELRCDRANGSYNYKPSFSLLIDATHRSTCDALVSRCKDLLVHKEPGLSSEIVVSNLLLRI